MPKIVRHKVLVVGDAAVGKSALTQMFYSGGKLFPKQYNMTCNIEYHTKNVAVPDSNDVVEMHIFDSAGQDIFADIMPKFWKDASAVLLVYDATRQHTFEACGSRYQAVLEATERSVLPGAVVANKMDQRDRIVVDRAAGMHFAEQVACL